MYKGFIGIDPSFTGTGISIINVEDKIITIDQHSIDIGKGKFIDIANASLDMIINLLDCHKELISDMYRIGMETPPIGAWFTEKLWSLDTLLYRSIYNPYVFNPSYISFLHGTKKYKKKDTMELINDCFKIFIDNGYSVKQLLLSDKSKKERKMTDNEADASVYAIRMFIKFFSDDSLGSVITKSILELYPRFNELKEEN